MKPNRGHSALNFRACRSGRGIWRRGLAPKRGENPVHVNVAGFDELLHPARLRSRRGGSGDVKAGDVGLHRGAVEERPALWTLERDAGLDEEIGVLLVSGEQQNAFRVDLSELARGRRFEHDRRGLDAADFRFGEEAQPPVADHRVDLRKEPELHVARVELAAAVTKRDVSPHANAADRSFHRRVLPSDDDHLAAEVEVRIAEVVADVGKVLPRDADLPRTMHVADGENDAARFP